MHAVGGLRSHYGDLRSLLHPSSDPISIALAYRDALGLDEPYLADLDAIAGGPPSLSLYNRLIDHGLRPWIDAGIRSSDDLGPLADPTSATVVLGLETLRGPRAIPPILDRVGPGRCVFSLDLFEGVPRFAPGDGWPSRDPADVALLAANLGLRRLLLLDLARVGRGRGVGTEGLLAWLRDRLPDAELAIGGGISSIEDAARLGAAGASAVLIGSALHDGRIDARALAALRP
ncbi:1-(5-phosphoribosyl)-5-[(5-phosphoribosylamino)methylideneamino] imidazole-4-carboxamide isomerase [Aquisphaera giovannonii]|uniref:1-(5-phosphoribosyl)-5-[(5-phosphoribosylamino)methylideneamino] imidazole-4-carboxamide isomerase n=1 Tax=Aquisphaera giovannonii TaxID=406548 RepID=A0A5B9W9W4_9BACT|nr:1-(5-phosphoribosyl)-5-[(5-phosphoribosylamino)methylideneamino] imidazole-4-carboxamide isomerase [Aquisphaera giovannonii]